jgi:SpoVK/Ycf46/Vps4 family AAA+-type ATPase
MDHKYEKILLDYSSKLDAMAGACGEITKCAQAIVETQDEEATRVLCQKISDLTGNKELYSRETIQYGKAVKDSLIDYYGFMRVYGICNAQPQDVEDSRSLQELLTELNELVGLSNVKQQVSDLIAYQTVQKMRRQKGLNTAKSTLHLAFTGNPGTGKTTVARIVGRVYQKIGLLTKGHFVEVSRTDLIAGYQGQTALKVKKVIDRARGGVLFIDEAYSITENDHSDSYGRECLTELTKALEDYRDDLVVIVAGYTEPMALFFEANPGLRSRFNTFIEFDDYSAEELEEILEVMCKKNDYCLDDALKSRIKEYFFGRTEKREAHFANARMARNVYDDLVMCHAKRVVQIENPDKEALSLLKEEDFIRQGEK